MNMNAQYTIDLERYGSEGTIVMMAPSLTRLTAMNNALSESARKHAPRGAELDLNNVPLGDLSIISVLAYVKSAPFKTTPAAFMAFCEVLDDKDNGSAVLLLKEMQDLMVKIDKGEDSPLADSQEQGSQSSD